MNEELIIRIMADGTMIPIILIGAYALLFKIPKGKGKRIKAYSQILVAGLLTYLFAKLIGSIFQPDTLRPFELLGTAAGASFLNNPGFPSDHTLFATAIACAVCFETKNKPITIILAILIIIVSVGRVLALVHTPIDVIGGVVIAILGSVWYLNAKDE